MKTFKENLGVKVIHVNAEAKFLKDLEGVTDPEEKRKIIGRDFVEIIPRRIKRISSSQMVSARHYISRCH